MTSPTMDDLIDLRCLCGGAKFHAPESGNIVECVPCGLRLRLPEWHKLRTLYRESEALALWACDALDSLTGASETDPQELIDAGDKLISDLAATLCQAAVIERLAVAV